MPINVYRQADTIVSNTHLEYMAPSLHISHNDDTYTGLGRNPACVLAYVWHDSFCAEAVLLIVAGRDEGVLRYHHSAMDCSLITVCPLFYKNNYSFGVNLVKPVCIQYWDPSLLD